MATQPTVILHHDPRAFQPRQIEQIMSLQVFADSHMNALAKCVIAACQAIGTWGPVHVDGIRETWISMRFGEESAYTLEGLYGDKRVERGSHPPPIGLVQCDRTGGGYLIATNKRGEFLVTLEFVEAVIQANRRACELRAARQKTGSHA